MSRVADVAQMVPVHHAAWTLEAGRVRITKRKFGRLGTRVARWLRLSPDFRLTLDAMGSIAWQGMDGRTAAEILRDVEAAFPDEGRMDQRFGQFLGHLVQHGLIRLEQDPQASSKAK